MAQVPYAAMLAERDGVIGGGASSRFVKSFREAYCAEPIEFVHYLNALLQVRDRCQPPGIAFIPVYLC